MKYPTNYLRFNVRKDRGRHPTQKPVALYEYLIETFSCEEETVLDITMGSSSTGVAALNMNRKYIGVEVEQKYYDEAQKRINEVCLERKVLLDEREERSAE